MSHELDSDIGPALYEDICQSVGSNEGYLEPVSNSSQQKAIGRDRICCFGHCLIGPGQKMACLSFAMIIIPSCICNFSLLEWYIKNISSTVTVLLYFILVFLEVTSCGYFISTAYSDPGIIPKAAVPSQIFDHYTERHRQSRPPKYQSVILRGHLFRLKYCAICNLYRAPRTIHCYVCNNCVENFDHHCPWVGNCVGRRNYRRFFFFLSSTSLLIVAVLVTSMAKLILYAKYYDPKQNGPGLKPLTLARYLMLNWDNIILVIYASIIIWFIVGLCAYHSYLISTSQSTYEQIKGIYDRYENPWDEGLFRNAFNAIWRPARHRLFQRSDLIWDKQLIDEQAKIPNLELYLSQLRKNSDKKDTVIEIDESDTHQLPSEQNQPASSETNDAKNHSELDGPNKAKTVQCGIELCTLPDEPTKIEYF